MILFILALFRFQLEQAFEYLFVTQIVRTVVVVVNCGIQKTIYLVDPRRMFGIEVGDRPPFHFFG